MAKAYRVNYKGLFVDVVADENFEDGRQMLIDEADERDAIMASVHQALDEFAQKVGNQVPVTEDERLDFCDDVAIWLANEMNEGRNPYEEVDTDDAPEPFTSM